MKTHKHLPLFMAIATLVAAGAVHAETPYGWSGNTGWIDFAPATDTRVSTSQTHLQGNAHAPNFGWIDLGDGSPGNGNTYANTSGDDFGVNHDGTGDLYGYAYSGNIGWINFGWATSTDPTRPKIDFVTGAASGYVYSGNVGWINLSELTMPGVTAYLTSAGGGNIFAGNEANLLLKVFGNETLGFTWMRDSTDIPGANGSTYGFPSAQLFHAGSYGVRITREDGSTFDVDPFSLDVSTPAASDARLVNISTRARSLGGDNVVIPGFVVVGTGVKQLLIRAVGPGLTDFGVTDALADPRLTLNRNIAGTAIPQADNNNWGDADDVPAVIERTETVGAFPLTTGSADAVLNHDAEPGIFTATTRGAGVEQGVLLVEVYDADSDSSTSRLSNLSIRAIAGTGGDTLIPGFVVSDEGPLTLLIRAVGPRLSDFGVTGVLEDPKISVFSQNDGLLFENDNWEDFGAGVEAASIAEQVGAFPLNMGAADAAMAITLAPGPYTVQVESVTGATGLALFELYEVR